MRDGDAGDVADMGAKRSVARPAAQPVGVTVIGSDNKKLGEIKDVLIDHNGEAKAVVISASGFLGVGGKLVAAPFKSMKWRTEGRSVEISAPSNGATSNGAVSAGNGVAVTKTDPAATEASQGYPDVAQVDMNQQQLKQAPDFQYAPEPTAPGAEKAASPPANTPAGSGAN